MRIRSKFQDYYDCGLAYGVDENILFIRETNEHGINFTNGDNSREVNLHGDRTERRSKDYGWVRINFLHFCGKVYPFYWIRRSKKIGRDHMTGDSITEEWIEYTWDAETANERFGKIDKTSWWYKHSNTDYEKEFVPYEDDTLNRRYNSPIVLEYFENPSLSYSTHGDITHIVNPCLKDIGFVKVVDPYTAFQEISMYLAMLHHPEDKDLDPSATDVEKVRQHGMDEKYGFRKPPESK